MPACSFGILSGLMRSILTSVLSNLPLNLRGMHLGDARISIEDGVVVIVVDRLFAILATRSEAESPIAQTAAESDGSPSQPPADETSSTPPQLPTGRLVRMLEKAILGLASRLAVRITNVHVRVESSANDTVAGCTLAELSLGGPTLVLAMRRGAADAAAAAAAPPESDLALTVKIEGLSTYVGAKAEVPLGEASPAAAPL